MNNTVKFALKCMGFLPYTRIVVRERDFAGNMQTLGGGYLDKVLKRYGCRQIERSSIVNEILYIDLVSKDN